MSANQDKSLLDEYNFKSGISAYENLNEREQQIHKSAFMTGYRLGQEHTMKAKTITRFVYVPNKNREVRKDIYKVADKHAQYIFNKVLRHYNRTYEEIVSPRRLKEFAVVRSVIVNLLREMTALSLPEIGRILGGRDHTTILHHLRLKFERRRYWNVHDITWKHYETLYKELELEIKSL